MFKKIVLFFIFLIPLIGLVAILGLASSSSGSSSLIQNGVPVNLKDVIPSPSPTNSKVNLSAEKLTELVNEWRVSQGFQPYVQDERLCEVARDRADDGDDDHQGFRDKYYSYPYVLSENMLLNGTSEKNALNAWLNSPAHRKVLNAHYKYACIATFGDTAIQIFSNFTKENILVPKTQKPASATNVNQYSAPTEQLSIPTTNPTSYLIDCYYKSEGGYILYDFGMVSPQKCNDLSNDWWNRKKTDTDDALFKICIDNASSKNLDCNQSCKWNYPPGTNQMDSFSSCLDSCSVQHQDALNQCN